MNATDPRTQVVTGLTRNGVWLIEDGRVVRPVTNLRFTQSFVDALTPGAVRGVGSDLTLVGGGDLRCRRLRGAITDNRRLAESARR